MASVLGLAGVLVLWDKEGPLAVLDTPVQGQLGGVVESTAEKQKVHVLEGLMVSQKTPSVGAPRM